jgi:hypothetical protein
MGGWSSDEARRLLSDRLRPTAGRARGREQRSNARLGHGGVQTAGARDSCLAVRVFGLDSSCLSARFAVVPGPPLFEREREGKERRDVPDCLQQESGAGRPPRGSVVSVVQKAEP